MAMGSCLRRFSFGGPSLEMFNMSDNSVSCEGIEERLVSE